MQDKEQQRIHELTIRQVKGIISKEELAELYRWLEAHPMNRERFERRINEEEAYSALAAIEEGERFARNPPPELVAILQQGRTNNPRILHMWRRVATSAAVLLLIATGVVLFQRHAHDDSASAFATNGKPANVLPGGNKAVLQLADGSRVDLSVVANGTIAQQGNSRITKMDSGRLSYIRQHGGTDNPDITYNMIFTPRGGTYQVVLPDHTIVWLNAESSLRFPTSFTGSTREVEVSGEAFFDVAKNKAMPFVVKTGKLSVEVLGTRFNIKGYADDRQIRTTLVDGAIAVRQDGQSQILKPGQQAVTDGSISVKTADIDEVMAWKEGYFLFDGADIQHVMREIGRWYNVEIAYEGRLTQNKLTAHVSRMKNAQDVLEILQASGYRFSISTDGKKITVLP